MNLEIPLTVAVLALGATRLAAQSGDAYLALTNATVIDGTGTAAQPHMTVVVRGRRIESVFTDGTRHVPADARAIDLQGQYLIPGLIDSHVHLGTQPRPAGVMEQVLRAVFMGGVTTVRDMGGSLATVRPRAMRSRADTNE
jgi:imidazolonepropionase-like amidohydrolase